MPDPAGLDEKAALRAVQEDPQNAHLVRGGGLTHAGGLAPSLAVDTSIKWRNGSTLRVKILNGSPKIKEQIRKYAAVWSQYANITFQFVDSGNADIRVNVDSSGGSWSQLGVLSLRIKEPQRTMNLSWPTDNPPEEEVARVIMHEFGHALGCFHEHQSPAATVIPWNREAVYAYYARTYNFTREQTDSQVLKVFPAGTTTQYSSFDPKSIMLYPIPAALTTNGYSVGWNCVLSDTDKAYISKLYPHSA